MFGWLRRRRPEIDEHMAALAGGPPPPPIFPRHVPPPLPRPALPVVWVPATPPPQVGLADIGLDAFELCPGVTLARLPADTLVFGGNHFVTVCGDRFLAEQFPLSAQADHAAIDALAPLALPVTNVDQEVLLIGRYGIDRWDVWLCELLPKLVLAERACPGRFAYLLPAAILHAPPQGDIWSRLSQTLEACGIAPARVLPTVPEQSYRFAALHAVAPVWHDGLHPQAAEALRAVCAPIDASPSRRLAIRPAGAGEPTIINRAEIDTILAARAFSSLDLGAMPFVQEVAAFRGANTVFAVLGASLAGLVFAPRGVHVIAAAEAFSDDRRIAGLMSERAGRLDILRQPATSLMAAPDGRFHLDPVQLAASLHGLEADPPLTSV